MTNDESRTSRRHGKPWDSSYSPRASLDFGARH